MATATTEGLFTLRFENEGIAHSLAAWKRASGVVMIKSAPHYLLFTEAKSSSPTNGCSNRWRFVLEEIGTAFRFEEADEEPGVFGERLQLLAVVRGLEAIEQPSRVTLITPSKFVGRGIRRSLTLWRDNDWHWERFGQMALVKDHDLWKRIDSAMSIHEINCRVWQFDPPQDRAQAPKESDQTDLGKEDSRVVSPLNPEKVSASSIRFDKPEKQVHARPHSGFFDKITKDESPSPPIQSEKLKIGVSRNAVKATLEQCERVDNALEGKIIPIGQGRAYGYAVN